MFIHKLYSTILFFKPPVIRLLFSFFTASFFYPHRTRLVKYSCFSIRAGTYIVPFVRLLTCEALIHQFMGPTQFKMLDCQISSIVLLLLK